jgi:glycosyltransferase involved in cell wall biosynthesis
MSANPRIEVLLATYNGERFLQEQVESILAQDYENLTVLARDDGSSDSTRDILHAYERQFPQRFQVMPAGPPAGNPMGNFLLLLKASTADYVCFSDQDDVWLPGKVRKAKLLMDQLEARWGTNTPLLVFSDLRVVDDKLAILHESSWSILEVVPERINRLHELIGKCVVTGCTTMLNRRLVELSLRMPAEAVMHDEWIGLLACAMGKSAFLREQLILYRQHDRNAVGLGRNPGEANKPVQKSSLFVRIRQFPQNREKFVAQWKICQRRVEALLRVHGTELPPPKYRLLRAYRQCETNQSSVVRVATWLGHRFFCMGFLANFAIFLHLCHVKTDRLSTSWPEEHSRPAR